MTVVIDHPGVVAEIQALMVRFGLTAETVVERVIQEAVAWMPMETLACPHVESGESEGRSCL
jgi:hypothetical protein